jgi:hypothetical protein
MGGQNLKNGNQNLYLLVSFESTQFKVYLFQLPLLIMSNISVGLKKAMTQ